ncbi:hypothetical protein B0J15DRAFT_542625 [Fusarium solani]|uniref:Uncharacterized protein n=1 Tax=Fusarium solani TaxID=169388 RepID=A0A9P9RB28_FUSSL|nr:uncharacterized protein B0J15DRAFT_542625 [Fusarium solani]KAH7271988.1 hypothetical protein B0J15DRAFT_542625 [Fusarium solani]
MLRPLQLESAHYTLPDILKTHKESFIAKAKKVLEHYGLVEGDNTTVDLLHRQGCSFRTGAVATLYITTPWKKDTSDLWPRAVEDIKTYMDGVIQGRDGIDLHIEMMAPERFLPKHMGPATGHPRLTEDEWDSVNTMVEETLESYEATKDHCVTISLFRLGYSERMEENPITIYISLSYESDEARWEEVIIKIENELHERDLDFVKVHFEHNLGWDLGWSEFGTSVSDGAILVG